MEIQRALRGTGRHKARCPTHPLEPAQVNTDEQGDPAPAARVVLGRVLLAVVLVAGLVLALLQFEDPEAAVQIGRALVVTPAA